VFVGKDRHYNRRFLQMCSHYLVQPVACTPVSGWEKGQVENQVGTVRQRFFSPRVRVRSYEELNAWLMDRCIAWAKAQPHPEARDKTIWQMFEAERPSLVPYAGPFDGFHAIPVSPSKTCLVRFDTNKYSVAASAVGRPVELRAYADRIELRQDGRIVGTHRRAFGRGETVYDPWHYVPVLARRPAPAAKAASPTISAAWTSSFSTSSAICPSPRPAASCSSTSSAGSTSRPPSSSPPTSPLANGQRSSATRR